MHGSEGVRGWWGRVAAAHPLIAEMATFGGLSFLIAALQYLLLTFLPELLFRTTGWGAVPAQYLHVSLGPIDTYVFDHPVTGDALGGLSYFVAFVLMLVISQGVNFPLQRNVTFRSRGNVWFQLGWYVVALVLITIACSLLMSLYVPLLQQHLDPAVYNLAVTVINGGVQLVIYFPVFKIIFPAENATSTAVVAEEREPVAA
ncbi:hypothetical protein QQX10_09005 [Demequina sp. SYSU T00039]|uniref:GtrA-like protein n=1 Tax=Demequina lignilytica TaxID=3051663 RepID=A0AAW7M4I3_9MICO|nr:MULTISPECIES: hypothetical protein [unclassified Demequina]MDN4478245.1 hypothetical protein [Demequina sp. SYSU T00039-1]MDN4488305.1 hypothetical protein [Demequina sp. SYSU T00039]